MLCIVLPVPCPRWLAERTLMCLPCPCSTLFHAACCVPPLQPCCCCHCSMRAMLSTEPALPCFWTLAKRLQYVFPAGRGFLTCCLLCPAQQTHSLCLLQWERDHFDFNFDTSKGPVTNEWFQGGRTNLAYNCLDRCVPLLR